MFKSAVIVSEPGNMATLNRSGWRSKRPVIDRAKCTNCLICWIFCPEPAVIKAPQGLIEIDYDHCKGCGICAEECPRKAISMVDEE